MACGVLQVYWCSDGLGNVGIEAFYLPSLLVGAIVILMMGFNYKYLIKAKEIPKTEKKIIFKTR
jgi:hypothetical protein